LSGIGIDVAFGEFDTTYDVDLAILDATLRACEIIEVKRMIRRYILVIIFSGGWLEGGV
jgi:hypothetical protein